MQRQEWVPGLSLMRSGILSGWFSRAWGSLLWELSTWSWHSSSFSDSLNSRDFLVRRKSGHLILRSVSSALLFGIRAAFFVYLIGEILVPDTSEYARGSACWSSPIGCGVGSLFGLQGIRIYGVIGALAFGALLGLATNLRRRILGVYVLPPGWYTIQASVDAAGAAIAFLALRSTRPRTTLALLVLTLCAHLVAFLVCLFVVVCRRFGIRHDGTCALIGGVLACLGEWHLQARYLLPGLAVALT